MMLRLVLILHFNWNYLFYVVVVQRSLNIFFLIWKDKKVYKLKNTYMFIYYNFFQV